MNHHQSLQGLLIATEPVLKSIIFTEELGPLSIESCKPGSTTTRLLDEQSETTPNISSLSILNIPILSSMLKNNSNVDIGHLLDNFEEYEIRLFGNDSDNGMDNENLKKCHDASSVPENDDDDDDDENQILLAEVKELRLKGLRERLADASLAASPTPPTNTKSTRGVIEVFLSKSESIVKELIIAICQHRQKKNLRKRQQQQSGHKRKLNERNMYSRPLRYYESLYEQCLQLEYVLENDESIVFANDDDNNHDETSNNGIRNRIDISDDLTKINILYHDEGNRSHELTAELPPNFPTGSPTWTADLPIEFSPSWNGKDVVKNNNTNSSSSSSSSSRKIREKEKSIDKHDTDTVTGNGNGKHKNSKQEKSSASCIISKIFLQYAKIIQTFQPFWNEMDDIDKNLWVLEPSLPSRRSCSERRIALREGLSITLVIDPQRPRQSPLSMRLSGGGKDIHELRKMYQHYVSEKALENDNDDEDHQHHWDETQSIRQNLEQCFGFELPSPESTNKTDFVNECGICYSHRLPINEGQEQEKELLNNSSLFPTIICGNSSCSRHYHESCLLEWLHSLPDAKVMFDRIHGSCPYCCESISAKFPTGASSSNTAR